MKKCAVMVLAGLLAFASPAFAAFTLTSPSMSSQSNSAAHSITTGAGTLVAGTTVIAQGNITGANSAADTIVITDTLGTLSWTLAPCAQPGATTNIGFVAYAVVPSGFTSKTITIADTSTPGTNWTGGAFVVISQLAGAAPSSPEDVAVRACNGSTTATATPSLTSSAPSNAGEFFFGSYYTPTTGTGFTYTEDAANSWTNFASGSGGTHQAWGAGYQTNAGSSALTHAPGTTSRSWVEQIIAFKAATPSKLCTIGAIGAGTC